VINIDESEEENDLPDTVQGIAPEEDQESEGQPLSTTGPQPAGNKPLNPPRRSTKEKKRPAYLSQFE